MAQSMVRITATVRNWAQQENGTAEYVNYDVDHWPQLDGLVAFSGGSWGNKNAHGAGNFVAYGNRYAKSWSRLSYQPHRVWLSAYTVHYTCELSFTIPATPAGYHISFGYWVEREGIFATTVVKYDMVGGSTYVVQNLSQILTGQYGTDWHTLSQPDEPGYNPHPDYVHTMLTDIALTDVPTYCPVPVMYLWYDIDEDEPDNGEDAVDITDTEADLEVYNECEEAWFEYGIAGQEISGFSSTPHQYTTGKLAFHLTGLTPCTEYWYRLKQICGGIEKTGTTYWFKTKCTGTMEAVTLGADDWWWMGGGQGLVRGLIKHTGSKNFYGHFGFQFKAGSSSFSLSDAVWLGTQGNESSRWVPPDPWLWPYQHVYNHLLPDRTYYYRAIWHHGRPPMTVDLYGETMSFSGVQSIAGFGYNHVTAKKAEDDISKLAAGRYYMDKSGVFQYESYQRRLA